MFHLVSPKDAMLLESCELAVAITVDRNNPRCCMSSVGAHVV